jgi:hypothetical protein
VKKASVSIAVTEERTHHPARFRAWRTRRMARFAGSGVAAASGSAAMSSNRH